MIKELKISGFRGFGEEQKVEFSLPDGKTQGSGLSKITGPNNSGKTTIIETIQAFIGHNSPSFSEGRRNRLTNNKVYLELIDENDNKYSICSIKSGGSSTEKNYDCNFNYYVVPSRRTVPFDFYQSNGDKNNYIFNSMQLNSQRSATLNFFEMRLFQLEKEKEKFDQVLKNILGEDFFWSIEQRDSGQYYIKYSNGEATHSAEGIGDGIWSIFTICAALFDAKDNSTVVIDEPELSVHPALQRKIMSLFMEYSKRIQIIICTHSPYFVNWQAIANGASLIRVVKEGINSKIYYLKESNRKTINGLINDINNPHTLGIEANEVFFLDDRIILVEGQEDVVIYNKISDQINITLQGEFYGWGVGGAPKMEFFLELFKELGYKKIVVILDGDKKNEKEELSSLYQDYFFEALPENDIRDKKERTNKEKNGITYENGVIKQQYVHYAEKMFGSLNDYFARY